MSVRTVCVSCRKSIAADDKYAGRRVKCPNCNAIVTFPTVVAVPAETPLAEPARASLLDSEVMEVLGTPPPPPSHIPPDLGREMPPRLPASKAPSLTPLPQAHSTDEERSSLPKPGVEAQPRRGWWPSWGKIATAATVCFVVGFFVGREYLKWEIRRAMASAADEISRSFAEGFGGSPKQHTAAPIEALAVAKGAKVVVLSARCESTTRQYGGAEITIHLRARNDNEHAVSCIYFHGVLKSPDRAVPWCDADFSYEVPGGLEAGETQEWELSPNMFERDWKNAASATKNAVFTVSVRKVEWPGMQ